MELTYYLYMDNYNKLLKIILIIIKIMLIKIDYREKELINSINLIKKEKNINIDINEENLDIGDIIICNDENKEICIIERKTLQDLASSIQDGRYKEQSFRLNDCELHNHYIIYLLEGNILTYKSSKYGRNISQETILSTITSIIYNKGFSIYKSINVQESAAFILQMTDKLSRIKEPFFYNNENTIQNNENTTKNNYLAVSNRVKKNNITPDNITCIMLCQIPGVSDCSASAVIEKFKTFDNLLVNLKDDPNALDDIRTFTKEGKPRRLTITCRQNIYNYLLNKIANINI